MSGVQFLAQAGCFFQTLLQHNSEVQPVSHPKIILGSFLKQSQYWGWDCEVLMSWMYRDNVHFIQELSTTESIMEAIRIRTPHTIILLSLSSSTVLPLPPTLPLTFCCLIKFQLPFIWWRNTDLLMASSIIHLSFYSLKKNCWKFN